MAFGFDETGIGKINFDFPKTTSIQIKRQVVIYQMEIEMVFQNATVIVVNSEGDSNTSVTR